MSTKESTEEYADKSISPLIGLLLLACAVTVVLFRLHLAASLPLWLDETWSAMISTQPDISSFWREAWLDCNPPIYYMFLTGWVGLTGDSNFLLRLPSIAFLVAAAALPLVCRFPGLGRAGSWCWAASILMWPAGIFLLTDARGYGLLLFLATVSCFLVARLYEHLSLGRAVIWVSVGTLMFLTHYYSATLLLAQAIVLTSRHRAALVRVWPAALPSIPGLAWLALHYERLKDYARPDVVWYDTADPIDALRHAFYLVGLPPVLFLALVILLAGAALVHWRRSKNGRALATPNSALGVAVTAFIGLAIALIIGMVQPSLAQRYLVPLVPATMLTIALYVEKCAYPYVIALVVSALFATLNLNMATLQIVADRRAMYGYEITSSFVQNHDPEKIYFVWDHPASKILDRHSLAKIGGYFVHRVGKKIPVESIIAPDGANINTILSEYASKGGRIGFIWIYNTARKSSARIHPPNFEEDRSWTCKHVHRPTSDSTSIGSIGCVRIGPGS